MPYEPTLISMELLSLDDIEALNKYHSDCQKTAGKPKNGYISYISYISYI